MGRELAAVYTVARETFEEADHVLGFPLSKVMWEGPEADLNDTLNTQPALYVHSLAAFRVFTHLFQAFRPAALAGHSLGELSALAAAGALSFETGLRLVRRRGELMKRAGEIAPGGMAAILNLDLPALEKVCAEASTADESVQVANDNCPGQVVISGAKAAVERAIEGAKAAGAKRAIPLAVSIAAHSRLMASIQDEWNEAVNAAAVSEAKIQIIGNVNAGAIRSATELRADIQSQMQSRVRWTETIQLLMARGVTAFLEVGTGSVLLGLIRRIASSASGYPLGNPADFAALE
jgi:[acyl-carrier-protein] S-malonyltransferase